MKGIKLKFRNISDMHTHSECSFDGNDSCDALCESAINKGAFAIAITDHCDIDGNDINADKLCSEQFEKVSLAAEKYAGKINVIKGLEIGQGIYRKEQTEQIIKNYDYDFILGSLHNLENMEDFYFLDYKKYDVDALLTAYFEGLLELCEWGAFDSLAHLTYPLRYIVAREKIHVDLNKYRDITDAVFETLAKNKKALEINTSGLFMDMKDTLPNIEFVKRFKKIGGEYITIGSDSHYADRICQGVEQGLEIAYKAGFRKTVIYRNHEPVSITIDEV